MKPKVVTTMSVKGFKKSIPANNKVAAGTNTKTRSTQANAKSGKVHAAWLIKKSRQEEGSSQWVTEVGEGGAEEGVVVGVARIAVQLDGL